jgi:hypothetical protein
MRLTLATKRLWPADAFRLLDTNSSGNLKRPELLAGLEWLGLHRPGVSPTLWSQQVDALFKFLDKDGNGVIDLEEFRTATELDTLDWERMANLASRQAELKAEAAEARVKQARQQQSQPHGDMADVAPMFENIENMPAIANVPAAAAAARATAAAAAAGMPALAPHATARLAPDMCVKLPRGRFKIKWQRHSSFQCVWRMREQPEDKPLSIWTPSSIVPSGRLRGLKKGSNAVKQRLALGHFASTDLKAPTGMFLLEVTDEKMTGLFSKHQRDPLRRFIDTFFPHPVRFRKVWSQNLNPPIYVWEPIPPGPEFIALGMAVTTEDIEPRLQEVRCVPKPWAQQCQSAATRAWTCQGAAPAASVWSIPTTGLFWVTTGASAQVAPDVQLMVPVKFYSAFNPDDSTTLKHSKGASAERREPLAKALPAPCTPTDPHQH